MANNEREVAIQIIEDLFLEGKIDAKEWKKRMEQIKKGGK